MTSLIAICLSCLFNNEPTISAVNNKWSIIFLAMLYVSLTTSNGQICTFEFLLLFFLNLSFSFRGFIRYSAVFYLLFIVVFNEVSVLRCFIFSLSVAGVWSCAGLLSG